MLQLPRPGRLFRNESGAFDLPSVLIGVAVVAILAVGVMALIFGAIPWAQNRAAAQDLAALTTAQGTAKVQDGGYVDPTRMSQLGYLSDDEAMDFSVAADESCWVAVTKAKSGKHFYTVDGSAPAELTRETRPGCLGTEGFTKISHTCAINGGAVYCWSEAGPGKPKKVGGPLEGKTMQDVSTGYYHACALDSEGQAYCWGENPKGEVGNGTATPQSTPVLVQGALEGKKVTSIEAGTYYTCAIADQRLYCWGDRGRMGDAASSTQSLSPLLIDGGALAGVAVKSVASSQADTCVLPLEGQAICWGSTDISNGKPMPTAVNAERMDGGVFTELSINDDLACGIASGAVFCWGQGALGSMYSGASFPLPVDDTAMAGSNITQISVTSKNTACAGDSEKNWYCWGWADMPDRHPVPRHISFEGEPVDTFVGTCALAGGKIFCSVTPTLDPASFTKLADPESAKSWVDTVLDGGKLP